MFFKTVSSLLQYAIRYAFDNMPPHSKRIHLDLVYTEKTSLWIKTPYEVWKTLYGYRPLQGAGCNPELESSHPN